MRETAATRRRLPSGLNTVTRVAVLAVAIVLLGACAGSVAPAQAQGQTRAAFAAPADAPPGTITWIHLEKLTGQECATAPVTFGQVFRPGDLPGESMLVAKYNGRPLPTQVDARATNDDGSIRHAVVTVQVPCDADDAAIALVKTEGGSSGDNRKSVELSDVLATEFDARLRLDRSGRTWSASARDLVERVRQAGGCDGVDFFCRRWLSGPLVSEWIVGAPVSGPDGGAHPHLASYFAIRAYGPTPVQRVRVDVVTENNWAYVDGVRNYDYDARIDVPGQAPTVHEDVTHYRQARWHEVRWWGASDRAPFHAAQDPAYLQSTPAVPSYGEFKLSDKMLADVRQDCPPMRACDIYKQMQTTGAQPQIGPLPRWSSAYAINTGHRVFRWMLANSDAMGAYGVHYRDKKTGNALSLKAHPCATTLWPARTADCPVPPHGDDRLPGCGGEGKAACKSPLNADAAHHPAPTYMAYLATGDWFYESEMRFWANWALLWQNPKYRDYAAGLVHNTQLRGQAWMLRSLAYAAYLLPDEASHKAYFNDVVRRNIDWYNERYTHNPKANKLGAVTSYYSVIYPSGGQQRTGYATWQHSFFAWSAGNMADLGFDGANALRDWVSQFQIGLMTAPGFCWELASSYHVRLRDKRKSPYYTSFAEVYRNSFPDLVDAGCEPQALNRALIQSKGKQRFNFPPRTMVGYPKSGTGFVANFQPGLAASARADRPDAEQAWRRFMDRTLPIDYGSNPQFGVVPTEPNRP